MLTLTLVIVIAAFCMALASSAGRVPLWAAVILLCFAQLLQLWPA